MAGEGKIGPRSAEPRIKVEDRGRSRRVERDELGGETGPPQEIAQIGQRAAVGRRHRGKSDERARDVERRGNCGQWRQPSGSGLWQIAKCEAFSNDKTSAAEKPGTGV